MMQKKTSLLLAGALTFGVAGPISSSGQLAKIASVAAESGGGEIQAYDPGSKLLIGTMDSGVEFWDLSDPRNPGNLTDIAFSNPFTGSTIDSVSSVAVDPQGRGFGAAALIPSNNGMEVGKVVLFDLSTRAILNTLDAGFHPDNVKFTSDGLYMLVANEGEPQYAGEAENGDVVADGEGSITIVDLSSVLAAAHVSGIDANQVTQVDFTAFNGKRSFLKNRGVRLFPAQNMGGQPTVAEDLEPEFIAFSKDNSIAFVTLQENNAFAVVDLASKTVLDIYPLGYKDHSRGLPVVKNFPFPSLPTLGMTEANDPQGMKPSVTPQEIRLGGFSGLWFIGESGGKLQFATVPDRGPNGDPTDVDGDTMNERPFALPDYQAKVVFFELDEGNGMIEITGETLLTRGGGTTPITGLPNITAADEEPVDLFGNLLNYDPYGADMESISIASDGTMWMVDEYRPAIYHFSASGDLIQRYVPSGTAALDGKSAGAFGSETLPTEYLNRRKNRGFEAGALDEANNLFYAFIQTPLENPDRATSDASSIIRILAISTTDGSTVSEYIYVLEDPTRRASNVDKIGDAFFIGNGKFIIIERDSATTADGKKYVFEIDLNYATDLIANPPSLGGDTLEAKSIDELDALGVRPAVKVKIANLPSIGYLAGDKPEGIVQLPDGRIAVLNDNDFGLTGGAIAGDGTIAIDDDPIVPTLGIIEFSQSNQLDPSNRDSGANLANWPVLGQFMPDTIVSYVAGGHTYYVTANEGDARDFHEARIKDLTINTSAIPDAANLQADANLGRLKTSKIDGDYDNDGNVDRLHAYGARSFAIWDHFGNLVYDSGDIVERKVLEIEPGKFNQDEGEVDGRSDDKGPEPEGLTIGHHGDQTLLFVGAERVGAILVFDISNPSAPEYLDYINPDPVDVSPEGMLFIPSVMSPNGASLVVIGFEESRTIGVFQIPGGSISAFNALTINGPVGTRYQVEYMDERDSVFQNLGSPITTDTSPYTFIDETPHTKGRVYRVTPLDEL